MREAIFLPCRQLLEHLVCEEKETGRLLDEAEVVITADRNDLGGPP